MNDKTIKYCNKISIRILEEEYIIRDKLLQLKKEFACKEKIDNE